MTRPRAIDATGADTRSRILSSAMQVIAERGYAQTRLADVADAADVSLGLVQHYFGTRRALLEAAFAAGSADAVRIAEEIASGPGTPAERLAALIDFNCSDGLDPVDGSWAFWFEFWIAASREEELALANREYDEAWQAAFAEVVADGIADGSFRTDAPPDEVAARIAAVIDGAMLRRLLRSPGAGFDVAQAIGLLTGGAR